MRLKMHDPPNASSAPGGTPRSRGSHCSAQSRAPSLYLPRKWLYMEQTGENDTADSAKYKQSVNLGEEYV